MPGFSEIAITGSNFASNQTIWFTLETVTVATGAISYDLLGSTEAVQSQGFPGTTTSAASGDMTFQTWVPPPAPGIEYNFDVFGGGGAQAGAELFA